MNKGASAIIVILIAVIIISGIVITLKKTAPKENKITEDIPEEETPDNITEPTNITIETNETQNETETISNITEEINETETPGITYATVAQNKEFTIAINETVQINESSYKVELQSISKGAAYLVLSNGEISGQKTVELGKKTYLSTLELELTTLTAKNATFIPKITGEITTFAFYFTETKTQITNATDTKIELYLECKDQCTATYIAAYTPNITSTTYWEQIGVYKDTTPWTGIKVLNLTTNVPAAYVGPSKTIKLLADSKNEKVTFLYGENIMPEKTLTRVYNIV